VAERRVREIDETGYRTWHASSSTYREIPWRYVRAIFFKDDDDEIIFAFSDKDALQVQQTLVTRDAELPGTLYVRLWFDELSAKPDWKGFKKRPGPCKDWERYDPPAMFNQLSDEKIRQLLSWLAPGTNLRLRALFYGWLVLVLLFSIWFLSGYGVFPLLMGSVAWLAVGAFLFAIVEQQIGNRIRKRTPVRIERFM
jgi:hypothetical protein